jgi:hypothetical protein
MFVDPKERLVRVHDGMGLDPGRERLIGLAAPHVRSWIACEDLVDAALVPVHRA